MSIIGGAIVPAVMGYISDRRSIQAAFAVPLFCYAIVIYFSFVGYKPSLATADD
jgi:MFS transporter, FHS family, L-fucose permease